jgi:hypothetical protein
MKRLSLDRGGRTPLLQGWHRMKKPQEVTVSLGLPFGLGSISGKWAPDEAEQLAAWEMYVELITRVSVEPMGPEEGILREALTSLYSLFGTTREILRRHGPSVATPEREHGLSFGYIAVTVLNRALRPLLANWHPQLSHYESTRPANVSPLDYERAWSLAPELRQALDELRVTLTQYADTLAEVAQVPPLTNQSPGDSMRD